MARKNENNYFDIFVSSVRQACKAANMLQEIYKDFHPDNLPKQLETIHEIEHQGDQLRHDMMNRLMKEFITPIEREDIMELSDTIDDVTDDIEDVVMRTYMYNIQKIRPEAVEMTSVIVSCCDALADMLGELHNFCNTRKDHPRQFPGKPGRSSLYAICAQSVYRYHRHPDGSYGLERAASQAGEML